MMYSKYQTKMAAEVSKSKGTTLHWSLPLPVISIKGGLISIKAI